MKKENIQSRNRKLSAKARKKHSSFATAADMLKPLEKMYGSYAGMAAMSGMGSYYMPPQGSMSSVPGSGMASGSQGASPGASGFGSAAAGMHMMAASTMAGFGAAPTSFGGMVIKI